MQPEENTWKPVLTSNRELIGPYPELVDLCNVKFPKLDFSQTAELVIADDTNIRTIRLPSNTIGVAHLVISDLPALEELHIVGNANSFGADLQWVSISNVPSLKRLSVAGDIRSLEIEGANALMDLDLSGCPHLDKASCDGASPSLAINARGCVKLRRIEGVEAILAESSGLADQIRHNQSMSRRDDTLYPSMTFTDVDLVADLINEGVKAMSRIGLLSEDCHPMLGRYDLMAYKSQFSPYSYRILSPLEPVYTGGTGETYAYVFIERDVNTNTLEVSNDEGAGNDSPESCLSYMLHWTRMSISSVPQLEDTSDARLLEFLRALPAKVASNAYPVLPIRLSTTIDSSECQALLELVGEVGMEVIDGDVERFIYVYPEAGIPPEDEEISWSATLSVDSSAAWNQLTRLRDWMASHSIDE
jgi:hypothetical protein